MDGRRQCGAAACTKSENGKLKFPSLNLLRVVKSQQIRVKYSPDASIGGTGRPGK